MKPITRSELLSKVHFYSTKMDHDKVYEHIPKSHLPMEYGGELESIKELNQKQRRIFENLREYFVYEEMQAKKEFDDFADEYDRI